MYDWQFTSLIMHRNAFVIHGTVNWFPRLSPDLRSESCFYCSHCILNPKQSILHVVQIVSNCFHVQMQAKCSKRNGIIDELCCGFDNNNNDGLCSIMRSSNFFVHARRKTLAFDFVSTHKYSHSHSETYKDCRWTDAPVLTCQAIRYHAAADAARAIEWESENGRVLWVLHFLHQMQEIFTGIPIQSIAEF